MQKRIVFILLISQFVFNRLFSQPKVSESAVLNEKVPDVRLKISIDGKDSNVRMSDFIGNALILDFWGTHCSDCIVKMPKISDMQKHLYGKVQFIFVTPESRKSVTDIFEKLNKNRQPYDYKYGRGIPLVTDDSVLSFMFPATAGVPMQVWIDDKGIYRASTCDNTTNEENIIKFCRHEKVELTLYHQLDISDDSLKYWFDRRIGFRDHLLDYEFFSKYDAGIYANGSTDIITRDSVNKKPIGLTIFNKSMVDLYRVAYYRDTGSFMFRANERVVLHHGEIDAYLPPKYEDSIRPWLEKNAYCYVSYHKTGDREDVFNRMQRDLDIYFGFSSRLISRRVKCFVVEKSPGLDFRRDRLGDGTVRFLDDTASGKNKLFCKDCSLNDLANRIFDNYIYGKYDIPFFVERGNDAIRDVELLWGENDYSLVTLKKSLKLIGLSITTQYRQVLTIVLDAKRGDMASSKGD